MASIFYKRYVPPQRVEPEEEPRRKKLKFGLAKVVFNQSGPTPQVSESIHDGVVPNNEPPTAKVEINSRGAHAKVRAKFHKSIERSAKLQDREDPTLQGKRQEPAFEQQHDLEPIPQPAPADSASKVSEDAGLPEWIRNPIVSHEERCNFNDFDLTEKLVKSLVKHNINDATPIQTTVLPLLLPGLHQHKGDLCISAATGSGKTLAYALPLIECFRPRLGPRLRGLVVVPTRELVNQVRDVLQILASGSNIKIGIAVGNRSLKEEKKVLLQSQWVYDPKAYRATRDRPIDDLDELMVWDSDPDEDDTDDHLSDHVKRYFPAIDILVCTPGRLVDHIRHTKGFNLHDIEFLVVDEADHLLDESFQEWLDVVLPELDYLPPIDDTIKDLLWEIRAPPRKREVRKVVVSATMTKDVGKLAKLGLRRPRLVAPERPSSDHIDVIDSAGETSRTSALYQLPFDLVEYASQTIDTQDKPLYLIEILDRYGYRKERDLSTHSASSTSTDRSSDTDISNASKSLSESSLTQNGSPKLRNASPSRTHRPRGTLIFTNSNESANRLSRLIELLRPQIAQDIFTLTKSSRSSTQRRALKALKTRDIIIVATDRASRGLDISNLGRVINYEMPKSVKIYVHRVGRTARAGNSGDAFTLVADNEPGWFWNVIAKGGAIYRARKVQRMSSRSEGWSTEEREAYQNALRNLGKDVKGH